MPQALARKGEAAFLSDRAVRLGLPMLIFGYLLSPLTHALAAGARGEDGLATFIQMIAGSHFDLGPLWFNQALLLFALIWVFTPRLNRLDRLLARIPGPHTGIALAIALWIVLAFVLRLAVPVGKNVFGMQLGYFASYLILFFGGAWGAQHRLLERITLHQALPWIVLSLLCFPTLWIYAGRSGAFSTNLWTGGWHIAALLYAAWEPLVATGVIVGALAIARRLYPVGKPWLTRLAKRSYTRLHHPSAHRRRHQLGRARLAATAAQRFVIAAPIACILSFVHRRCTGTRPD